MEKDKVLETIDDTLGKLKKALAMVEQDCLQCDGSVESMVLVDSMLQFLEETSNDIDDAIAIIKPCYEQYKGRNGWPTFEEKLGELERLKVAFHDKAEELRAFNSVIDGITQ